MLDAIKKFVAAWNALPGGQGYSPRQIEDWMSGSAMVESVQELKRLATGTGLRPASETSYPYLHIARTFGVDYGDVLLYADFYATEPHKASSLTEWHARAYKTLSREARAAVCNYVRKGELP